MIRSFVFVFVFAFVFVLTTQARLTPEQRAKLPPPAKEQVDFAKDIQPIIEKSCVKCHGKGRDKGGFVLETRESLLKGGDSGPAVVAGNSAESLLIELVSGLDPDEVMPQKGTKLTSHEVSLMRAWIDQGIKWDPTITFAKKAPVNLKPRKPELAKGNGNPIDRILKTSGKSVSDGVFARRAFLDATGLIPPAQELENFEKSKNSNKRAALVRELLDRRDAYAEHWMSFWNDALRNDYRGTGYIDGGRRQISTWIYSALSTNMPFNQFVSELINPNGQSDGFIKGIVWRGVVNASQTPEMQAAQNISQVFMGVNLKCASCHDSFINDWRLVDSYGLASVYSDKPLEMVHCDKPLGKLAAPAFIYPELGTIDPTAPKKERMKRLAEVITGPEDGRLSRTIVNRLWQKFFGRAIVEPVDDMEAPAWNQDLLDWLAADLQEHNYDLKHTIELMLTSKAYQLPAVAATQDTQKDFVFRGPLIRRLSAEEFVDALGQITGVWSGNVVPEINFANSTGAVNSRWIWSQPGANKRTAAETVYFRKTFDLPAEPTIGRVVITCDNSFTLYVNGKKAATGKDYSAPTGADIRKFLVAGKNTLAVAGVNGEGRPGEKDVDQSNPAGLFVHVLAKTKVNDKEESFQIGADASWKFSTNKVSGWEEAGFDDSKWNAAVDLGEANLAPWNLGKKLAVLVANQDFLSNCRSVLANADPLTTALGRPNREQVITTRASAATTLQALELTNGHTLASRLKTGAENLASEKDPNALVNKVYLSALGRKPTPPELATARDLVGAPVMTEGVEDLLWAVAMLPEFQLIR